MTGTNLFYDVVVLGGGPAGVVAAVQSARANARTLLVEKSGLLGGAATLNGVNFPGLFHAWGRQVVKGIGWEWVEASVREMGDALPDFSKWSARQHYRLQIPVNIPVFAALADELAVGAGVDLLFHTMPAGLTWNDGGAAGPANSGEWEISLCGKDGLTQVRSRVVIDCTGDANAVALAGFPVHRNQKLQPGTLVMQTSGYDVDALDLPALEQAFLAAVERGELRRSDLQAATRPVESFLKGRGGNSMHVPDIDASTSRGKSAAEIQARAAVMRIFRFFRTLPGLERFRIDGIAPECGVRETATIEGEARITVEDYVSGRVWPDSICYSFYPLDVHAVNGEGGIDTRPLQEGVFPTIPLGAMLPKGSRNLIAAGRCICGDQQASSAYRVQASAMAMGQAAGAAGAICAASGVDFRGLNLADLRTLLIRNDAIVPEAPLC